MSLTLQITSQDKQLFVRHQGDTLTQTTIFSIPNRADILENPFTHGPLLFELLGGQTLLDWLNTDSERLLYLDIPLGDQADTVPWECAIMPPRTFFVHRYGCLRLVNRAVTLDTTPMPLRLVALGADALVTSQGQARDMYRLDILQEMRQIEKALANSGKEVVGVRIAPTAAALRAALSDGRRTLLHLSCHGSLINTDYGSQPVLHLEDENGAPKKLLGDDFISFTSLADLRLILLSACRLGQNTEGGYGKLTRMLVEQGVPAAIGMQGLFPDNLSDDLAAALYQSLLNGQPLGKALQAARLALREIDTAVGLPVCYVAQGGDVSFPLTAGHPRQQRLDLSEHCRLPIGVQLPDPFVGRNAELHTLARLAQEIKVITIIGTGGMGKTALAAAYARRFALRYQDGVYGYSFAASEVDAGAFRRDLLRHLVGDELADQTPEQQEAQILDTLRSMELLLLIDNYESIQQTREDNTHLHYAEGKAVHNLLKKIANNGGRLLLTSRQQPAGFKGERVFPGKDHLLQGVNERSAADLFYLNSPRALENRQDPAVQQLARAVGRVTAGHPLAVALLGSEYDQGDIPPATFLDNWEIELQTARSHALDDHHATFATAFNRSFTALNQDAQQRLQALSLIPFPFFATGATLLWEMADEAQRQTKAWLRELVDRSFIEIEGYYQDKTPATWHFQPAIRQEVARRLSDAERTQYHPNLGRYAAWLSRRAYKDIHQEGNTALVNHVRPILDTLIDMAVYLLGTERLWHLRRVGWLLKVFGRTHDAYNLLQTFLSEIDQIEEIEEKGKIRSSILYEIANLEVTRGDLDKALALYEESLALKEQIGDIKGKAASLSMMAQVYLTRGDLDKALALYEESLATDEQIGDIKGKAASLHNMAQVYVTRGDLDKALALYEESLAFLEQIGDIKGKAASLHNMAHIYIKDGQLDKAESLLTQSLQLNQTLSQPEGIAFVNLTLGQIMQAKGDIETTQQHYSEALHYFQKLGMIHQAEQVKEMIVSLSSEKSGTDPETLLAQLPPEEREQAQAKLQAFQQHLAAMSEEEKAQLTLANRLRQAVQQAQAAAEQQTWSEAITYQQEAVTHARKLAQATQAQEALIQLSILLYNLAGYYQQAQRHEEAVTCYEEVVAIDEQTGHEDLESDQQALARAKQLAAAQAVEPTEAAEVSPISSNLETWLAQLPPQEQARLAQMGLEEREQVLQAMAQFAALPQEEQTAILTRARIEQIETTILAQLTQLWDAISNNEWDASQAESSVNRMEEIQTVLTNDETLGPQRHDLVALLRCTVAYLRGQPLPPIPAAYAGQWADWTEP